MPFKLFLKMIGICMIYNIIKWLFLTDGVTIATTVRSERSVFPCSRRFVTLQCGLSCLSTRQRQSSDPKSAKVSGTNIYGQVSSQTFHSL